jgi:hypothetical protein
MRLIGCIVLAILMSADAARADGPTTRPALIRYATSRTPGEGCSGAPLSDVVHSRHTPWDHPYVDAEAADAMDNLRFGNLDALSSFDFFGGLGFGWLWTGSFGVAYNTGYGGLPR